MKKKTKKTQAKKSLIKEADKKRKKLTESAGKSKKVVKDQKLHIFKKKRMTEIHMGNSPTTKLKIRWSFENITGLFMLFLVVLMMIGLVVLIFQQGVKEKQERLYLEQQIKLEAQRGAENVKPNMSLLTVSINTEEVKKNCENTEQKEADGELLTESEDAKTQDQVQTDME